MRTKMLQRRLEKLEAVQTDDPPALVIYSWVSPEENGKAEPGASDPLKQVADSWARGGAVEKSSKGPGAAPQGPHSACGEEEPDK